MSESIAPLEGFCAAISQRLGSVAHPRAVAAVEAWNARHAGTAVSVQLYTGLSDADLRDVAGPKRVSSIFGLGRSFQPNEFVAAARAVKGWVSAKDLRAVLNAIHSVGVLGSTALDEVTATMHEELVSGEDYEQGFQLAQALRKHLGRPSEAVDPEQLLGEWRVSVRALALSSDQIDAVSVWGPAHGPLVVVNSNGRHANAKAGRNATVAHEICHILVDRHSALPLAEAVGGMVPQDLEARARAFAAELLAPQQVIAEHYREAASPRAGVERITRKFGVSRELVAWQLRNSRMSLADADYRHLRSLVGRPQDFDR